MVYTSDLMSCEIALDLGSFSAKTLLKSTWCYSLVTTLPAKIQILSIVLRLLSYSSISLNASLTKAIFKCNDKRRKYADFIS